MGRAVIVDLSGLDRALKGLEESVRALKSIVERADRGVPVRYQDDGTETGPGDDAREGPAPTEQERLP